MTELSLNVLDIAQNSVKAKASLIEISVDISTAENRLTITIKDNGCGMDEDTVNKVTDPFYTTRTTRKVGLGVPFFKMSAEMTGGHFNISSEKGKGTEVIAEYVLDSIDRMPLGDMPSTVETLVLYNTDIDFIYKYSVDGEGFELDTVQMKDMLGGIPLDNPNVAEYIKGFLRENTDEINKDKTF